MNDMTAKVLITVKLGFTGGTRGAQGVNLSTLVCVGNFGVCLLFSIIKSFKILGKKYRQFIMIQVVYTSY